MQNFASVPGRREPSLDVTMDDRAIAEVLRDRGGSAQRMALAAAEDSDDVPMDGGDVCDLAEAFLYLFGWGTLSLPNINWLARSAIKAGASHPELTVLPPGRVSAASRRTSVHIGRASFVTICSWRRTE